MGMTPTVRKIAVTAHVTSSVGWLGAVAAFLALALDGLISTDARMVPAAYLAMEFTTWFVILPLALASLITGIIVSLGTAWGLFRHYWVLAKLLITIIATLLLLLHTHPIGLLASVARESAWSGAEVSRLQMQLVGDAGLALLALLVNVALSVFKPGGMTPYGLRKQQGRQTASPATLPDHLPEVVVSPRSTPATPGWVYVVGIHVIGLALLFLIVHLAGGGDWLH